MDKILKIRQKKKKKLEALKSHSANKREQIKKKKERKGNSRLYTQGQTSTSATWISRELEIPIQLLSFKASKSCIMPCFRATESIVKVKSFWSETDELQR